MNRSLFARFSSLCLVFVPAITACSMTDIAGEVGVGSVGGQTGAGGTTNTVGGQVSTVGGQVSTVGGTTNNNAGGVGGIGGTSAAGPSGALPCDVLQDAGNPCVAAHSTVRLLNSKYAGPLYQLCKGAATPGPNSCQGITQDILAVGGYADVAAQKAVCATGGCTITKIYDQSGLGNDLEPAPPGGMKATPGNPVNAADLPVKIGGHDAYGLKFRPGMGYRKLVATGLALGDEPEAMYMVTSQKDLVNGCCFDYGNAETSAHDDGNGTMEAVYVGQGVIWGSGSGPGPWAMADLENGLYAGWERGQDSLISTNTSLQFDFITAAVVGDTQDKNGGKGRFAVYGGDATTGPITTMYDGIRPEKQGYVPMLKQGSLILSIGGDNSDADGGRFYEGAMANGAATKQTIDALQASIVAAGYGKSML